jgi:uncharacterized protein (TIGR03083 family)
MTAQAPVPEPTPDDLRHAAALCRIALEPAAARDWGMPAGDLTWSCRQTLDHMVSALVYYAGQLATGAPERVPRARTADTTSPPAELLGGLETAAAILAAVVRGVPPGARGFHPAGRADGSGFVAMGCTEMLVHANDIARGLGLALAPPPDLAARVLGRLFPWAPQDADPWATLLWACGRAPLGDRPRQAPDWYWHCAPLSEWDGQVRKRPPTPGAR